MADGSAKEKGLTRVDWAKADVEALRMIGKSLPKPVRPGGDQRRQTVRRNEAIAEAKREFWTALPDVTAALIDGAKKGRATHLKMLMELGGLTEGAFSVKTGRKAKRKSMVEELIRRWEENEKAVAAEAEATGTGEVEREDGGKDGV